MALLRSPSGEYYVRSDGQLGSLRQASSFLHGDTETIRHVAEQMRSRGLVVSVVDDAGNPLEWQPTRERPRIAEEEIAPLAESVDQAAPAPLPEPTGPIRMLRPGDQIHDAQALAALAAEREARQLQTVRPPESVEYEQFYSSAPAAEIGKRMKNDPQFLQWVEVHAPASNS